MRRRGDLRTAIPALRVILIVAFLLPCMNVHVIVATKYRICILIVYAACENEITVYVSLNTDNVSGERMPVYILLNYHNFPYKFQQNNRNDQDD